MDFGFMTLMLLFFSNASRGQLPIGDYRCQYKGKQYLAGDDIQPDITGRSDCSPVNCSPYLWDKEVSDDLFRCTFSGSSTRILASTTSTNHSPIRSTLDAQSSTDPTPITTSEERQPITETTLRQPITETTLRQPITETTLRQPITGTTLTETLRTSTVGVEKPLTPTQAIVLTSTKPSSQTGYQVTGSIPIETPRGQPICFYKESVYQRLQKIYRLDSISTCFLICGTHIQGIVTYADFNCDDYGDVTLDNDNVENVSNPMSPPEMVKDKIFQKFKFFGKYCYYVPKNRYYKVGEYIYERFAPDKFHCPPLFCAKPGIVYETTYEDCEFK